MRKLLLATHSFRLHAARLREPLVQVWLMTGMALILVIMGHVHAVRQSGDWKNLDTPSALRLLSAGPRVQWTDDFAPAGTVRPRPAIDLGEPSSSAGSSLSPDTAAAPDWRVEMASAASRPWTHLAKAQRQAMDQAARPASGQNLRLIWTGDPRGNAALHSLQCQRLGQADPSTFVIGNGSRSQDGGIEITGPLESPGPLVITLIGTPRSFTADQKAALGELLNYLEARFGPVVCRI